MALGEMYELWKGLGAGIIQQSRIDIHGTAAAIHVISVSYSRSAYHVLIVYGMNRLHSWYVPEYLYTRYSSISTTKKDALVT